MEENQETEQQNLQNYLKDQHLVPQSSATNQISDIGSAYQMLESFAVQIEGLKHTSSIKGNPLLTNKGRSSQMMNIQKTIKLNKNSEELCVDLKNQMVPSFNLDQNNQLVHGCNDENSDLELSLQPTVVKHQALQHNYQIEDQYIDQSEQQTLKVTKPAFIKRDLVENKGNHPISVIVSRPKASVLNNFYKEPLRARQLTRNQYITDGTVMLGSSNGNNTISGIAQTLIGNQPGTGVINYQPEKGSDLSPSFLQLPQIGGSKSRGQFNYCGGSPSNNSQTKKIKTSGVINDVPMEIDEIKFDQQTIDELGDQTPENKIQTPENRVQQRFRNMEHKLTQNFKGVDKRQNRGTFNFTNEAVPQIIPVMGQTIGYLGFKHGNTMVQEQNPDLRQLNGELQSELAWSQSQMSEIPNETKKNNDLGKTTSKDFEGYETPPATPRIRMNQNGIGSNNTYDKENALVERQLQFMNSQDSIMNPSSGGDGSGTSAQKKQERGSFKTDAHNKYDRRSLYLFPYNSWLRQKIIIVVDSKIFEYLMAVIILFNSVTLALYDYKDRDSKTTINQINDKINLIFTCIFVVEACLKIIAKGLIFHSESFLRNGWNLIDSVVVISGILELTLDSVKLKALRVVRVFRPFKSINVMPSMKKLIQTLIQSLPDFANVGAFLVYVFLLFATMGLHQYNGAFNNICRYKSEPDSPDIWAYDPSINRVCSKSGLGNFICPNNMYCGNNNQFQNIDLNSDKIDQRMYIDYGITNFNNLGTSLLTVFQIINSDTWYPILINLMDADIPFLGALYCLIMIVIGQFFLMNLILAVIIFAFIKTQKKELANEIKALNDNEEDNEHQQQFQSGNELEGIQGNYSVTKSGDFDVFENHKPNLRKSGLLNSMITKTNDLQRSSIMNKHTKQYEEEEEDFASFLRPQAQKRKVANLFIASKDMKTDSPLSRNDSHNVLPVQENQLSFMDDEGDNNKKSNSTKQLSTFAKHLAQKTSIVQENSGSYNTSDSPDDVSMSAAPPNASTFKKVFQSKLPSVIMEEDGSSSGCSMPQKLSIEDVLAEEFAQNQNNSQRSETKLLEEIKDYDKDDQVNDIDKILSIPLEPVKIPDEAPITVGLFSFLKKPDSSNNPVAPALGAGTGGLMGGLLGNKIGAGNGEVGDDGTQLVRVFQRCFQKKIEKQYHIYFKNILKEAKINYSGADNDNYAQKTNLRELVGLKVGLQMIKEEEQLKQKDVVFNQIEQRSKNNKCFSFAFKLMHNTQFIWIMAISIIINMFILSLDRYPVGKIETSIIEKINIAFTIIFAIEMVVKMVALGPTQYFRGGMFNVFDCIIVISSFVDIALANFVVQDDNQNSGSVITALRGFRLLRIFKLAKNWKRFELLLETLGRTLIDIATFSILLFLFIFTFTLLGLELFAHRAKLDFVNDLVDPIHGKSPPQNFDDFLNSFTTVFIVLTNDASSKIFYDHYRTVGAVSSILFFILLVIIGQKILLNLFLAILLENFDEGALKHKMHEFEQLQEEINIEKSKIGVPPNSFKRLMTKLDNLYSRFKDWLDNKKSEPVSKELTEDNKNVLLKNIQLMKKATLGVKKQHTRKLLINPDFKELEGVSLNFFKVDNRVRKFFFNLVTHRRFDFFIIIVIVLSAVQLALDSPVSDPDGYIKKSLLWIDLGTTIIFFVECMLKILAFGFLLNGQFSYLRNNWNILDFVIIIFSILSLTPLSDSLRTIKIFRILRLLRLISRNEELKVAVRALFFAIPNVANVTIIMLLFFLIFGVIAVSYFKGKLFYCNKAPIGDVLGVLQTKWDCLSEGGEWKNKVYNFDNAVNALVTLFVLSTTAGWADVMMQCIQSIDIDYVPNENAEMNAIWVFFFIIFIIVGAFFFLNLFVGVVISTFNSEHDKLGGNDLLTEKQKEWIDLRLLVLRSAPQRKLKAPMNKFRSFFFKIQENPWFERLIMIFIVSNSIVLTMKWYEQPNVIDNVAEYVNYIFTSVFIAEAVIKLIAITPIIYFRDGWNLFDFIIILGSLVSIFISGYSALEIRGVITILRSFRILRLVRLIKRGKSLQLIFNTIVITLHSLANIGALLLLFIFMYAIMGMILLGQIKRNGVMNDYINFENFQNGFLTLFIVATGDTWNDIMGAFTNEKSPSNQCLINPSYDDYVNNGSYTNVGCGSKFVALSYFLSYMFVVNLIFLKIFIAIILQGYNDTQTQDSRLFNTDMNDRFQEVWTSYDPDATNFIKLSQLRAFLFSLGEPLGFDKSYVGRKFMQDQFIASLELPTYQNFSSYQFLDVLDALSFRLMVLDHLKKNNKQKDPAYMRQMSSVSINNMITKEMEKDLRDELQKEINQLIFQKNSEFITAVKEVSDKETKRLKTKQKNKDQRGLTSQHHMAAEATVRKMKFFLRKKRGNVSSWGTNSDFESSIESNNSRKKGHLQQSISTNRGFGYKNKNTVTSNAPRIGGGGGIKRQMYIKTDIIDGFDKKFQRSFNPLASSGAFIEEGKQEDSVPRIVSYKDNTVKRGILRNNAKMNGQNLDISQAKRNSVKTRRASVVTKHQPLISKQSEDKIRLPPIPVPKNIQVIAKLPVNKVTSSLLNNKSKDQYLTGQVTSVKSFQIPESSNNIAKSQQQIFEEDSDHSEILRIPLNEIMESKDEYLHE